jgi:hypothetical protein
MGRHFIVAIFLAVLMTGAVHGQQRVTVIGCVAPSGAEAAQERPFALTNVALRDTSRGTRGSNSPRSSTPVGGGAATARSGSSGSTTPKGSTPVRRASVVEDSSAATVLMSAKASVPIARRSSLSPTYELEVGPTAFSLLPGQTVEVRGSVLDNGNGSVALAPRLKVEEVRMLSATCTTP